jgi:predicted phosphoribosyltransferase
VSVITPPELDGVGSWYEDFRQTSDDEVRLLLRTAARLASHRISSPEAVDQG